MSSSRACPSPPIPGAWPGSTLTLCLWRRDLDCYPRSYQNQPESHWYGDSRPTSATLSTADETSTNSTTDDSSFFTVANTSFLSAYTTTTPSDFSPFDPRQHLEQREANKLSIQDQSIQSLPEIPDLSSLSSSRDQLPSGPECSIQHPLRQYLDGGPFEPQENSFETNGPNISSYSSIRFRAVGASSVLDPSETSPGLLRHLQIERGSYIPFPRIPSYRREPRFSGPTQLLPHPTGSMSEYTHANKTWTNSRRSSEPGESFFNHYFQQEDLNAMVYANDLLDCAFEMDNFESSFVLEPFDVSQDNVSVQSSNGHTPSRQTPLPTMVKGTRAKFLHTIRKMRSVFMKLKTKDREKSAGL